MRAIIEPTRLVTLMALATFGTDRQVSITDIATRATTLQGPEPVKQFTKSIVGRHCQVSLKNAGLVTIDNRPTGKACPPATHVELTSLGWTDGLAIAGAHLDLQLATPQDSFLENALGTKVDPTQPNPRPPLYQVLFDMPRSIGELAKLTGHTQPTVSRHVSGLTKLGVLSYVNLLDPVNQTYEILADPTNYKTKGMISASFASLIKSYYDAGRRQISGAEMIQQADKLYPELTPPRLWAALRRWASNPDRARFISPADHWHRQRSIVQISPEYRPYLARLFETWRRLTDPGPAGADFRVKAISRAWEITNSQPYLRRTLHAHIGSAATNVAPEVSEPPLRPLITLAYKPAPMDTRPQPFRPFIDPDKIMWLSPSADKGIRVAYIEACGATLEVNELDYINNVQEEPVACNDKEKLALLLLSLGASLEDIDAYAMDAPQFKLFMKKLGYQIKGKVSFLDYNRLAYDVCQAFLEPVTATDGEKVPEFTNLPDYLGGRLTSDALYSYRERYANNGGAYTREDRTAWQHFNLLILLSHADEQLPPIHRRNTSAT